jgi:hypothetical protein
VPSVYEEPPDESAVAPSEKWRNSIIGYDPAYPVDKLLANPNNWRVHPRLQRAALKEAIEKVGLTGVIKINVRSGNMTDGHLRALAADEEGQTTLPTIFVDQSPEEEAADLASYDTITLLALTDKEKLGEIIGQIASAGPALSQVLAEQLANGLDLSGSYELSSLGEWEGDDEDLEKERSTGELLEKLKEGSIAEPRTECHNGDVYRLGNHVLVVADPIRNWSQFTSYLTDDQCWLVIYPGPFAALSEAANGHKLVLVQPDLYLAGHLVDRYVDVYGASSVIRL